MTTATLPLLTVRSRPPAGADLAAQFLTGVAVTLLPLLAAVAALELSWLLLDADAWPAVASVVAAWALATAGWLRRRRWPSRAVRAVIGAPVAVLSATAAVGWLSPAGLVLWGPVSTVLAVALAMTAQPLALGRTGP